jgi:predicted nucleic acid-binding protein
MISYFDTSVIMGLLDPKQEIHEEATVLYLAASEKGEVVTTTLHTYSELYNNLTKKGGGRPGLKPEIVTRMLNENLDMAFKMVELNREDYKAAVARCGELEISGPVIYDALHLQAALKAGAKTLYTDNLRDFTRLVTKDDPIKIVGVR